MTLAYRCSNCGAVLQTTNADPLHAENDRLRAGLDAAIRAANLALFVIRKQGVMPNSSWQAGFEKDMGDAPRPAR